MVHSDNVDDNIFTISIPPNFTSPSFDYRTFSHGSKLKNMLKAFHGYIIMLLMMGYKCRICEMFPLLSTPGDYSRAKFASEAFKSMTGHSRCYLKRHVESETFLL